MLIGQYKSKIDAKHRLAIPAKVRQELGKSLILARFYEGSLVLVNETGWDQLMKVLTGKSKIITAAVRETQRFIMGGAFELEMDSQGRVVIPQLLYEYASLKKEAVFVCLGNRVEVWDEETWHKKEKESIPYAGYMLEKIDAS